ncbi:putative type IX secretion system sortase PorU2 [Pontibacter akesuensis]|nr:C25 family cysteine peptidase [Pontibacter akesuensis]
MKRFLFLLLVCISCLTAGAAQAQELYGNEWIDYSKTYYKLKVTETGLYKLDHAYLSSLGIAGANPQHLQLFRRGKEVAIYVAGESDGRLDPQDFVEFFGERNDGVLDQELYKNPAHQVHQLHSMYTDTAAYFLTINTTGNNKRMREVNPAVAGRTPEPYHLQKALLVQANRYSQGRQYEQNWMPWMDAGEGYSSSPSTNSQNFIVSGVSNVETTGPVPILTYAIVGPDSKAHNVDINLINGTFSRNINNLSYGSYSFAKATQPIAITDVNRTNNTLTLQLVPKAVSGSTGAVGLAYAQLLYPQKSVFIGGSMTIYTDSLTKAAYYYELAGAPSTVVAYDVTEKGEVRRIEGHAADGRKGFVIDGTSISRKVLLANTAAALIPAGSTKGIKFRNIKPEEHNYLIVSNKVLMQKVGTSNLAAPAAYAAYRGSAAGGGYDTLLVFVDDLVNQFHYGEFSSNSIKKFCSYMSTSAREKHLLLLGKGVEADKVNYRNVASRAQDIVPTGGFPASDILFSVDFRSNDYTPKMATGRVSSKSALEIINYLDKLKVYEATPAGIPWRKNVLHLGGGKTAREIRDISNYIDTYTRIAEGPFLGANVTEKTRQNLSEVIEELDVSKEVNSGLSLLTFFGHSSPTYTDLNIGYVSSALSNYSNEGKYPVILMNGCNVGNAYINNYTSFGEDWLNTPKKGAIAMIAHVGAGYPDKLHIYASNFYSIGLSSEKYYGQTLGMVQREVINRMAQGYLNNTEVALVLEIALQGDPAVHLYNPSKPDYLVTNNSLKLRNSTGDLATVSSDSLKLSFNVENLGKAITDSISVSVKRTFPDNTVSPTQNFKIGSVYRSKQVELTLPNKGVSALGINIFEVTVDSDKVIDELNEDNNTSIFQHYLSSSGLSVVYPLKYSIVGKQRAALTVQANVEKEDRAVYFELDTTSTFDSPWVKNSKSASAAFASWDVDLINNNSSRDSIVYYWRARFDSYSAEEDTVWVNSSFRHIPEVTSGWSQSHKGQFKEAKLVGVDSLDQDNGKWKFSTVRKFLDLKTAGGSVGFIDPPYGFFIDGAQQLGFYCGRWNSQPRFYMFVFNNVTLEPVTNLPGQTTCNDVNFLFDTGPLLNSRGEVVTANLAKLKQFMDVVPEGYHVAVLGMQNVPFSTFTEEAKEVFRSIGSVLINDLKTGDPFAIVGRKGAAPGTAQEITYSKEEAEREGGTPAKAQSIELNVTLESTRQAGTITSTTIGPALKWGSLHHNIEKYKGGDDKYKLSLIGVDATGAETVLQERVQAKSLDISNIDATAYPNLKLSAFLSDSTARTAPQLKEWFVLYEAAPEGVIRPDLVKAGTDDLSPIAGRGSLTIPMAFQNLTSTAFSDSLTVEVTLSGDGLQPTTSTFKIKPAGPEETVMFSHMLNTKQFEGNYKVSLYVNPRILPEQEYGNNIYEVSFNVKSKLHPIMNVAFDGIQILDGDIVSPSPLISVVVKDENDYVFLKDPSQMSVVMVNEFEVATEINLMNNPQEVKYVPATEKSDFKLEYKPNKLEDGKYRLEVRAKDAVGKESGVTPYRIGFEVISESSVTNFYPFPNPFSTKTNFIFTLTGSTIPEHMKIQILTVTGKVVKEIMKEELGPLRIGNNKTEYAWDGTDMYGDKLANGVYLYRVIMSKGQEEMKHRITFGDKAFKNGYGKLYILR